jgi:hypothetical protein
MTKTETKSCYIATFWLGDRRAGVKEAQVDRLYYLKTHLSHLSHYSHDLTDIYLVFNLEEEHHKYLPEIVKITPDKIQNANVNIVIRENKGMSYGAWNDIVKLHKGSYDYYIFNEDDYYFVQDNWDKYLVDKFNSYPDAGYVCPFVEEPHILSGYRKWAGSSAGISSGKVLNKVLSRFGELPHSEGDHYKQGESSQITFSYAFIEVGYNIYDIRDEYRVVFANTSIELMDFNKYFYWNDDHLVIPASWITLAQAGETHTWWFSSTAQFTSHHKNSTIEEAEACREQKLMIEHLRDSRDYKYDYST